MRSFTMLVSPPDGYPGHQLFEGESVFRRERIYNLTLLEDGTLVLLGRLGGDLEAAAAVLEERSDVLGFSISGEDETGGLVFVHSRPPPAIQQFLALRREHEVFFDFPIEGTRDGRLRVVMVGQTNEALQQALAAVPPEIDVTVERIGPYAEDSLSFSALLTDRQREILDVALDLGYYEIPRKATHRDIAEEIGVTVGTVSEHLQKIEARVFGAHAT